MKKLLSVIVMMALVGCDTPKENIEVMAKGRIDSDEIRTITLCENGKLIYVIGVKWGYAGGLTSEIIGECEVSK